MTVRQKTADKPLPANKQKGKKVCSCCHEEKKLTDFYISKSPLFSLDERVPVCKKCILDTIVNCETGVLDEIELNKMCRKIDKPFFKDSLMSAYEQFANEHSYVVTEDIKKYGKEILQLYFKNIAMRQDRDRSYEDSERDGFMHQNNNRSISEKSKIKESVAMIVPIEETDKKDVVWTKKDKQNMKYVLSTIGYDPFENTGLDDMDRKYCFNILAGYCDTDGISEDGHKMQGVIEMTMLYCQCKKITEAMNIELSGKSIDDVKIQKLTSSKSSLLSSIATIAKDNNISSNYNKNSKQGQNSLSSKMKEMSENGFAEIEVNLFDIKTSESFKQIDEISNNNIANQLTLDNNEYAEIVKEQRELVQKYSDEIEELKEENRVLKNKIIDLESKKR